MMTSNIAESTNRAMGKARRLPVTAAHEFLRCMIQRWFSDRHEVAGKLRTSVTATAAKHCNELEEIVNSSTVRAIREGMQYQVVTGEEVHVVDFGTNSCDCRRWDLDRLPCSHALAAARYCPFTYLLFFNVHPNIEEMTYSY